MLETEQKVQLETILKTCDEINASNESAGNEKLTEELYKLVGQYDKKISKEYYKQLKAIKVDLKKQKKVLAKIRNSLKKAMKSKDKGFRDQAIDFNKKQIEIAISIRKLLKRIQQLSRALVFKKYDLLVYLIFAFLSIGFLGAFKYTPGLSVIWAFSSTVMLVVWKTLDIVDYLLIVKTSISRKTFLFISKSRLPLAFLLPNAFIISAFFENVLPFVICLFLVLLFESICFLCDTFWQSDLFNDKEDAIVLAITLIFGALLFVSLIPQNSFFNHFLNGFLIGFSLILTALCVKKSISESHSFTDDSSILSFLIFVGSTVLITIYTFYRLFWRPEAESQPLFAAIVGVYAAILGGTITLSGVAWTIRKSDLDRKEEEKKKNKPVFTINKLFTEPAVDKKQKICFDAINGFLEYSINTFAEIENSNCSSFFIKSIFHDSKWWSIEGDTVVLPGNKVALSFRFNQDVNNLFLQVQDILGNAYYYELKVLSLDLLSKTPKAQTTGFQDYPHTIRSIKEISLEELKKRNIPLEDTP